MKLTPVQKYLRRYAENESDSAKNLSKYLLNAGINKCLVIPLYDEDSAFLERLKSHQKIADTLIIAVLNHPASKINCPSARRTARLYQQLASDGQNVYSDKNLKLQKLSISASLSFTCC